jgi:hypothetical protein
MPSTAGEPNSPKLQRTIVAGFSPTINNKPPILYQIDTTNKK